MKLEQAQRIAEKYKAILKPYCDRIEIAGSIRRKCPQIGDIEIVCIPDHIAILHLFGDPPVEVNPVFIYIVNQWEKVKGNPEGKYTQRILPEGIKLDLFMATEKNWGLIFAIRTGSAAFSHKVLATGWVKAGYKSIDGYLRNKGGSIIPVREEIDLFNLLNMKWKEPTKR